MTEAFLIAVMNMVSKVGFDATISFLKNRGATIDDAIKALETAGSKSLAQYKAEDLAGR